jgi:hypothetical protein
MAKKKPATRKPSAAAKTKRPSASKQPPKKQSKRPDLGHDHHHGKHDDETELDATESKAIDLVLDSEDLRHALEVEVNSVVTQAVRKICKAHGASLTVTQAQNVAMVLFGD